MAQTIFEQLAPYAGMTVVPGVTVGKLAYANSQDLFSDATFQLTTGDVPANTTLNFYVAAQTEVGQGFTTGLTISQSNSKFSKGQPPANQVFIGTHLGFSPRVINTQDPNVGTGVTETLLQDNDVFSLIQNFSWDLTIGRGITRTIGSLLEYPSIGGTWASTVGVTSATVVEGAAQNGTPGYTRVKLPVPIIFPPLVNVQLTASCGNSFRLTGLGGGSSAFIAVRATMSGFLMTMPV